MTQPNFKRLAEELEKTTQVITATAPPAKKLPALKTKTAKSSDSAGVSGGPWDVPKDERLASLKSEDVNKVVRAVLEYALSCAEDHRTPVQIGEAVGFGISAAAKELNVPRAMLSETMATYLSTVSRAAKSVIS